MSLEKEFRDFATIGHSLAEHGVFIDGVFISFDLVNPGTNIVSYTATSTYHDDKEIIIAESDNWNNIIIELFDILTKLEDRSLTVAEVYERYKK